MSTTISIEIDILPALNNWCCACAEAWRRALQKTGAWVKTCVTRKLGKTAKIPRKALMVGGRRSRLRLEAYFDRNDEGVMKVWLGLRPVDAHRLAYGKGATQTRGGGARGVALRSAS